MFSHSSREATFSKSHLTNSGELRGQVYRRIIGFHKKPRGNARDIIADSAGVAWFAELHLRIAV